MASNVDVTKPAQGTATTESVRANMVTIKAELEALQDGSGFGSSVALPAGTKFGIGTTPSVVLHLKSTATTNIELLRMEAGAASAPFFAFHDSVGRGGYMQYDFPNNVLHIIAERASSRMDFFVANALAMTILPNKDIRLSAGTSALATSATGGFPGMPTMAGAPIGTPTNESAGFAPFVLDTATGSAKLWVYDPIGNAWYGVALS